jgi:hypothetical protein
VKLVPGAAAEEVGPGVPEHDANCEFLEADPAAPSFGKFQVEILPHFHQHHHQIGGGGGGDGDGDARAHWFQLGGLGAR